MNIWIFNHYAISPGSSGITRDYDLAKRLLNKGHQVTIFASSFDHRSRKEKHFDNPKGLFKEEYHNGIRYVWVRTTPYHSNSIKRVFNILSYTIRGYIASKKVSGSPDVVMGTLVHPLAAFLGYLVSKHKKSLFYFEERDLWPETLVHLGKFSKRNPVVYLLSKLELFLYKKSKRIIVLFDKAPKYVEQRGISIDKVLYIPNGVDLETYQRREELSAEVTTVLDKLQGKFLAIYTGAHGLANRLDLILDAAKDVQEKNEDIHFLFVGDGVEKNALQERKNHEDIDNVTFMDPIPKEQIPSLLSRANVGLIAMWDAELYKWGMSLNKAYDYMAAKIPTIIQCNIDDTIIEKSGGGLKVPDANGVAEALEYLYKHPKEAEVMGIKARDYVEKYHSWEQMSETLIRAIEEDVNHEPKDMKEREFV